MPSVLVSDFKYGVDRRRPRVAGVPGTLWAGTNCHISRGGDIERAKKFVPIFEDLEDTFGLGQINGQLFVFGSDNLAASMPNGVQYQRLQLSSAGMVGVLYNNTFDNKHYVVAEYDDGNLAHFYNGSRVTELDALADAAASYVTLADYLARKISANAAVRAIAFGATILVTANTPGTAYTISAAAVDGGGNNDQTITATQVQANVAEVAEVRATGTVTITGGTRDPGVNRITQVTVDGVGMLSIPVDWITSNNATATALAVEINNNTSAHGFSASAAGAIVTIQAEPGTGATPNGDVVAVTVGGNVTADKTNMAGGVTYVAPVAQIYSVTFGGTFQAADKFTVTIDGTGYIATGRASAYGTSAFVYKSREYTTAASLFRYCALNDPTDWTDATASIGAGFINVASDSSGNERLVGAAAFENFVALFARSSIRTYRIFADSELNEIYQSLENTGTIAPRSVTAIASPSGDILYLDEPGIRALRVRDVNTNAFVGDMGSQIDPLVIEWVNSLPEAAVAKAVGVIEPVDGRYMLAIGSKVFVLSYFPSAKINAWTVYEPDITITDFARVNRKLYSRDEDTIYLLGGEEGDTYPDADEQEITIDLPFNGAKDPAEFKEWLGLDIACRNVWDIDLLVDPDDETKVINIGRVTGTTYGLQAVAAIGEHPIFAVRAVCADAGFASLSAIEAHYAGTGEK